MIAKNFRFIKPFDCAYGTIPIDTELMVIRDAIYINGMQIMPQFYGLFHDLVNEELTEPYYLREIAIPNSLNNFK